MRLPPPKTKKKKSGDAGERPDLLGNAVTKPDSTPINQFLGTNNPRYLRAIQALMIRPMSRKHLDDIIGCANTPDAIFNIRELGLGTSGLPCTMIDDMDRDGKKIRRGIYSLTDSGRRAISAWLRLRDRKDGQ